jgi:hypothetical protein
MPVVIAAPKSSCQKWETLSAPEFHLLHSLPPNYHVYIVRDDCSIHCYSNSNSNEASEEVGDLSQKS